MMVKDFNHLRSKKEMKPTRKQEDLYRGWRKYLRDSRLSVDEQHKRAAFCASNNEKVPTQ